MATAAPPTTTNNLHVIPARRGIATLLPRGRSVKIINTTGTQVIDTWAFTLPPGGSGGNHLSLPTITLQYLSMAHTHAALCKLVPGVGDTLVSNERKGIVTVVEDTTGGAHDTLVAACDRWKYEQLGGEVGHRNCADNLVEGLQALRITPPPFTPAPLNLFMNIPVHEDKNTFSFGAPISKPGDYIVLRAEMDLVVVFSACPQDIIQVNSGILVDAHYELL